MITIAQVLRLNALSCIAFGLIFLLMPTTITHFLSQSEPMPMMFLLILGAGLIINGLHLIITSLKTSPKRNLILYFSVGDFLWVVFTLTLILTQTWITTTEGIMAALIISVLVGGFGILQLRKINGNQSTGAR